MKKWYSVGLLLLVLVLAAALLVACESKEETTTTAAPTTAPPTTAPPTTAATEATETTAAAASGITFEDLGNSKVHIQVIAGPDMIFDVSTEGGFAQKIEAFDADGESLGLVELPESAAGVLDYSSIEGIAKLIVTDVPHGNVEYEYLIP
jgi:hypothetical protein